MKSNININNHVCGLVNSLSYDYCPNRIVFQKMHYSTDRRRRVCDIPSLIYEMEKAFTSLVHLASDSGSVYDLTYNDFDVMKKKLLSGNYTFSPLKLLMHKCSTSGSFFVNVEASLEDELVLYSIDILLRIELRQSSYLSKSCSCTYSESIGLMHLFREMENQNGLESILFMDSFNSIMNFSRERLLEKVKAIVNNHDIYQLIECFCNLPLFNDETGNDYSVKTGIPPLKLIGGVLFDIILDDIDRDLTSELPNIQYYRHQHIFLFTFTDLNEMNNCIGSINEIFHKNHFIPPITQVALKGGSSIDYSTTIISISDAGKCEVDIKSKI